MQLYILDPTIVASTSDLNDLSEAPVNTFDSSEKKLTDSDQAKKQQFNGMYTCYISAKLIKC